MGSSVQSCNGTRVERRMGCSIIAQRRGIAREDRVHSLHDLSTRVLYRDCTIIEHGEGSARGTWDPRDIALVFCFPKRAFVCDFGMVLALIIGRRYLVPDPRVPRHRMDFREPRGNALLDGVSP